MDARNEATSANTTDLGKPVAAAPASFDDLPNEVLERILAFTYDIDVKTGAALTIANKRTLAFSNKPLAAILVKYLQAADQPTRDANSKRKQALKLAACKPFSMFTSPAKNVPCAAAYAAGSADVYIQSRFLEIARKENLLAEWLKASENTNTECTTSSADFPAIVVNTYYRYKLPDLYLLPLFYAYHQVISTLIEPHQNNDELLAEMENARLITINQIGREIAKLKRWLKDELFRQFESWINEDHFKNLEPVENWIAEDVNIQDMESSAVTVNDYRDGSVLGVDLAIYRGHGNVPATARNIIDAQTCIMDFSIFARLYKNRKARQNELVASVRATLSPFSGE